MCMILICLSSFQVWWFALKGHHMAASCRVVSLPARIWWQMFIFVKNKKNDFAVHCRRNDCLIGFCSVAFCFNFNCLWKRKNNERTSMIVQKGWRWLQSGHKCIYDCYSNPLAFIVVAFFDVGLFFFSLPELIPLTCCRFNFCKELSIQIVADLSKENIDYCR